MDPLKFNNNEIRDLVGALLNTTINDRETLYREIISTAVDHLTEGQDTTFSDLAYALQSYAFYLLNVKKANDPNICKLLMESIESCDQCSINEIFLHKLQSLQLLHQYIVREKKTSLLETISQNIILFIKNNHQIPPSIQTNAMLIAAHTSLYRVELLRRNLDTALHHLNLCAQLTKENGGYWESFVAEATKIKLLKLEFEGTEKSSDYYKNQIKEIEDFFWACFDSQKIKALNSNGSNEMNKLNILLFDLFLLRCKKILLLGKQVTDGADKPQNPLTAHEYIAKQVSYLIPIPRIKKTSRTLIDNILKCEEFIRSTQCLPLFLTYFPEINHPPFVLYVPKEKCGDLFEFAPHFHLSNLYLNEFNRLSKRDAKNNNATPSLK